VDILIQGNEVASSRTAGIGLYGAQEVRIINNTFVLSTPKEGIIQKGISAAVWEMVLIENNTIIGSANYGIDFGGWGISDNEVIIRRNILTDFGEVGIYDNSLNQGSVLIEYNVIRDNSNPYTSNYGIRTDFESNRWTIRYNEVFAGSITAISAPSSDVYENMD
jgi:hypothetical protein